MTTAPTTGPWAGHITIEGTRTLERPSESLLAILTGDGDAPPLAAAQEDGAASLVPVRVEGDALVYESAGAPIAPGSEPASRTLDALARAARALATVHASGRAHGDVRPDTLRREGEAVRLLAPARPIDAGRLLAARTREGAPPEAVAYAAPEVVRGEAGTPASDVYALAALAYRAVAGRPPLGQLEVGVALEAVGPDASGAIGRALHPTAKRRPGVAELGTWLAAAARTCQDLEAFSGGTGPEAAGAGSAPTGAVPLRGRLVPARDAEGDDDGFDAARPKPQQLSAILVLVLLLGGALVLFGALAFVTVGWESMNEGGRAALLVILTMAVAGGGLAAGSRFPRTGFALLILSTQLLWPDVIYILVEVVDTEEPGPWLVASLLISGLTWALAWARRSPIVAAVATADLIGVWVSLAGLLHTGSDRGPMHFLLLVAFGYAAVAAGAHRAMSVAAAMPATLAGGACAGLSALSALFLLRLDQHEMFASLWPYLVLVLTAGAAAGLSLPYRLVPAFVGASLFALVPLIETFWWHDHLLVLQLEIALGLATLAAAFHLPRIASDGSRQSFAVLLGLLHLTLAPGILCIGSCGDTDGWDLFSQALGTGGHPEETDFAYLSIVIGISAGLVALAFLFAPRAARKTSYRLLEAGGLALFFFTLTALSLARSRDFFYPLLVFGGGFALLGLGVWKQRVTLVGISAVALLVNSGIQYFAKLSEVMNTFLLIIGFGVALLAGGLIYEQKVKHLLPKMSSWS